MFNTIDELIKYRLKRETLQHALVG